ncbi:hypothetical protein ACIO6U_31380 [Streptomyces sp. NPDC087422]|uniref:hypothetical protein n=1 Tax=Streptomyces sp. NPDC087422 TaxID=3365786 RepID=UPI00380F7123
MPSLTTGEVTAGDGAGDEPGAGTADGAAVAAGRAGLPARLLERARAWRVTPYAVVGTLFWLVVAAAAWRTPIASDFGQHASAVERVKADWRHPANPLLDLPGTGSPYFSPYIVALGLIARATGAAGREVVRWCGPVNLAVLVTGVGVYARTLSRRPMAPVYALLAFTLLWGVQGKEWSGFCGVWSLTRGASYPSAFAVGVTFHLWALTDRLARRRTTGWAGYALLGVACGLLLLIHPITALAAAVGIVAVLTARQRGWSRRVTARWLLAGALALLVAVAWPYYDVFSLAGDTTVDAVHKRLYIHPWQWYGLALVGLPPLLLRARRGVRDPLVLMFAAFCLIVAYGWVSGHYTYGRVFALLLVPPQFALAVELASIPPWTRLRAVLAPVAAVALCFGVAAQIGAVVPQRFLPVTVDHPVRWPGYGWAADRMPADAVVLTDGYYATHVLPAYGFFLVAPTWPDPSTPAAERDRRFAAVRTYLDPKSTAAQRAAVQRRYGVGWLLLTKYQKVPPGGTLVATGTRTSDRLVRLAPVPGES